MVDNHQPEMIDEMEETKEIDKKSGWKYELFDLARTFVICFIAVFLITTFLFKPVKVDGDSMRPTLHDEEIGVMNIISRKLSGVKRFDVVVVYNEKYDEDWVKRVIGLPGDRIYAKDDVVYVNGKPIDEPYLNTDYANAIRSRGDKFTEDFPEQVMGEDEYFLMGDNRINSSDSRVEGGFKGEHILGKDIYVLFPFSEMKIVGNGEKD